MRTLVIGYGNRSRGDDSVGWVVVERLRALHLPQVELCTTHQLEVDFADTIRHFDMVIFVDAAVSDSPQRVARRVVTPQYQAHAVAHFLSPADLLSLCGSLYGDEPQGVLFSIRGENFEFGDALSPVVDRAADDVVRQIARLVSRYGQPVPPAVGVDPGVSTHA